MIKFVVLLTTAITFNFTLSFGELLGISNTEAPQEVQLVFSEDPIGFESGQPVYPVDIKVYVKSSTEKELSISINGSKEYKEVGTKVDISKFLKPHADTYTVVVVSNGTEEKTQKIFGFTTK